MLNNFFDKVYLINLERRKDRLENFKLLSKEYNFDFQIKSAFDGINNINRDFIYNGKKINYNKNEFYNPNGGDSSGIINFHENYFKGQIGCLISHLEIIKDAKLNNYEKILIFEDDVEFVENFDFKLNNLMTNIKEDWEMLYLSGSLPIFKEEFNFFSRIKNTHTTHSYAIKNKIYNVLIKLLEKNIFTKPVDSCYVSIQDSIATYLAKPYLTFQKDGFSDIQHRNTNYASTKLYI